MRYRLSVEDRWDVMHQVVSELQHRFSPAIEWTSDLITDVEFERIERRLATLIQQKIDRMNEAAPDEVDYVVEDPPWSREVLISRNLPPGRSYENDVLEMDEARAALALNRPSGSGEFVKRASVTGNIWVLSRGGTLLNLRLSPVVRWTHWLSRHYHTPAGEPCCRAPDPNKALEKDCYGHFLLWASVCR